MIKTIIIIINKKKKEKKKEIRKFIKMTMEAIMLMISWHSKTMKMRNNSNSKYVEKNNSKNK